MTSGQVAERLGVSPARVRQLDSELRPARCACGVRIYDERAVEAYEARRAVQREQLSAERRERMLALRERRGS